MNPIKVFTGITLIFLGFTLLVLSQAMSQAENVEYGGVVIIGPIPIVFGSSTPLIAFAVIVAAAILLLFALRW